ncbi:type IV secretion system protein [Pseudomonadota bacterium]
MKSFYCNLQKYFRVLPIVIMFFVLFGCDGGPECVEADDFGEYQITEVIVPAKEVGCEWDEADNLSSKSSDCILITGPQSASYDLSVMLDGDFVRGGPFNLSGTNCLAIPSLTLNGCEVNNPTGTGTANWGSVDCSNYLTLLKQECINRCITECRAEQGDSFKPSWVGTKLKSKGGIRIDRSTPILVDVIGEITLSGALPGNLSSTSSFVEVNNHEVQTGFIVTPSISSINTNGRWCDNNEVPSCTADNLIGLISDRNIRAEKEFLRRLVIFSRPYLGDQNPIDFDFNSWDCVYDNGDDSNFVDTCRINYGLTYPTLPYGSLDSQYGLTEENLGKIGGVVARDAFSLNVDQFENYVCSVTSGTYGCNPGTGTVAVDGIIVGRSGNSISFNLNEGGKLKFKILPTSAGAAAGTNAGLCDIRVENNTTSTIYNLSVNPADISWRMLTSGGDDVLFNPGDNISISVSDPTSTWETLDPADPPIPCGQGLAVLKEKTKDVLIEKSGFVSFKILGGSQATSSGSCSLEAKIINPNNPVLDSNYFEYSEAEEPIGGSNNSWDGVVNADGGWYGEVFVRKGQIIRFYPSSFNGTWTYSGNTKKCGVGLAMKIEHRPAVLCKNTAIEEFRNPSCVASVNDPNSCVINRETICNGSSNFCISDADLNNCQDADPATVCSSRCRQCMDDLLDDVLPTQDVDIVQCYDLEDYTGSVSNLLSSPNLENFKLRGFDYNRGYGNLESANCFYEYSLDLNNDPPVRILDTVNTSCTLSDLNISARSRLDFFVLEDVLNFKGITSNTYSSNSSNEGDGYQITTTNLRKFRNGDFLEAVLCKETAGTPTSCTNVGDITGSNILEGILEIDKGSIQEDSMITGAYGYLGNYDIDDFGRLYNSVGNLNYYEHFRSVADGEELRLSFRVYDPEEEIFGGTKTICDKDNCEDYDVYFDNTGQYRVRVRVKNISGDYSIVNLATSIIDPILSILDGKDIRISDRLCNDGAYSPYLVCYRESNGESCGYDDFASNPSQNDCYRKCSVGNDSETCSYVQVSQGLLEKMYNTIIDNNYYATILNLSVILAITFYGFGFFIGMTNFTQSELLMKLISIAFVYLLVNENGWFFFREYAVRFFKQGIDFLTFTMTSAFDISGNLKSVVDYTDKSVLFKSADDVISLFFNGQTQSKVWGLFFASWFGWAYVGLIYLSMLIFIVAVANALILYLTAQIFTSILLSLAPMFIIFLLFKQTKGMFDKWLSVLISFGLQQVMIVATLGFFSVLLKEIIKMVLSYRVCWEPIWVLDVLILPRIELFSFYKITGIAEGATPDAIGTIAPGIFHILFIYLVATTAQKFIQFMAELAESMSGGLGATTLAKGALGMTEKVQGLISSRVAGYGKKAGGMFARRVGGVKTEAEKKEAAKSNKELQNQRRDMNKAGNAAVDKELKSRLAAVADTSDPFDEKRSSLRKQLAAKDGREDELRKINSTKDKTERRRKLQKFDKERGGVKRFMRQESNNVDKEKESIHRKAAIEKAEELGLSTEKAGEVYDMSGLLDVGTQYQGDNVGLWALHKTGALVSSRMKASGTKEVDDLIDEVLEEGASREERSGAAGVERQVSAPVSGGASGASMSRGVPVSAPVSGGASGASMSRGVPVSASMSGGASGGAESSVAVGSASAPSE